MPDKLAGSCLYIHLACTYKLVAAACEQSVVMGQSVRSEPACPKPQREQTLRNRFRASIDSRRHSRSERLTLRIWLSSTERLPFGQKLL